MLDSLPYRSHVRLYALGVICALTLLIISLSYLIVIEPISLLTFLWALAVLATIPVLVVLFFWRALLSNARYTVEKMVLTIHWGRLSQSIPLNQIRALNTSSSDIRLIKFRGISLPGLLTGYGHFQNKERAFQANVYSTSSVDKGLFIETDKQIYLISPADADDFKTCIEALPVDPEPAAAEDNSAILTLPPSRLWEDRSSQLLLLAPIVLNLLLFGLLTALISRLDGQIPLHFDPTGVADRSGTAASLLILPIIGLVAWLISLAGGLFFYFWRDERPMAQLIWAMTVVIELATWAALFYLAF